MKLDAKLCEEDADVIIECEERCILVFKYIRKSLDGFCYDFDEHRDVQKEIVVTLVCIVEIIEQMVNCLHFIFYFVVNFFQRMRRFYLFVIRFSNKLIWMGSMQVFFFSLVFRRFVRDLLLSEQFKVYFIICKQLFVKTFRLSSYIFFLFL